MSKYDDDIGKVVDVIYGILKLGIWAVNALVCLFILMTVIGYVALWLVAYVFDALWLPAGATALLASLGIGYYLRIKYEEK
jgi:hypothetical protein